MQVHVGTGISTHQGMISISETKRNHMGQGLGYTEEGGGGGEAKQLLFFYLQKRRHYIKKNAEV